MNLSRRGLLGMFAAGVGAAIITTPGVLMPARNIIVPKARYLKANYIISPANYDRDEVYRRIFEHFGHEVEIH